MPGCLVTGGSGFLGSHLVASLKSESELSDVIVLGRRGDARTDPHGFRRVDLLNVDQLNDIIAEIQPSTVYHLAGKTPPADAEAFYRENTLATVHLLDALRIARHPCRVVLIGSAAELGLVPVSDLPVGEDYPCQPVDSYGLSKWLATCAGLAASPPLEVVIARVFNPIGPGLPVTQALGRFAEELARGSEPVRLVVGDLDSRRDFVDVRDVARALIALGQSGQAGRIYHVGTGHSHRVGDGLEQLIALSGRQVEVKVDSTRLRSAGPTDSRADIRKIKNELGWSAQIFWEQSLADLWNDALSRVRSGLTGV